MDLLKISKMKQIIIDTIALFFFSYILLIILTPRISMLRPIKPERMAMLVLTIKFVCAYLMMSKLSGS